MPAIDRSGVQAYQLPEPRNVRVVVAAELRDALGMIAQRLSVNLSIVREL